MDEKPNTPITAQPKSRRRWYQYSLRTLLIFTLVFAVASGALIMRVNRKNKERDTVEFLEGLNWWVRYDYQLRDSDAEPPGLAWLRSMLGDNFFCEPRVLWATEGLGGGVSDVDADLPRLAELPTVETLILSFSDVSDRGLEQLRPAAALRCLKLDQTKVTDDGMPAVASLRGLEQLDLRGTNIGDAGVANLVALGNLKELNLCGTQITDAAIPYLQKMSALRRLDVEDARFSQGGMARLRKALRNCTIGSIGDEQR